MEGKKRYGEGTSGKGWELGNRERIQKKREGKGSGEKTKKGHMRKKKRQGEDKRK